MGKILNSINQLRYFISGGAAYARKLGTAVGSGSSVLTRRLGSEPWLITIGDNTTVSTGVTFLTHDGSGRLCRDEKGRRHRYARIRIGDNVFIGAQTILMPGVSIEDNCVVAAGSVVTKSIPSGSVVAGNPARFLCTFAELMVKIEQWPSDADIVAGTSIKQRSILFLEEGFKGYIDTGDGKP